MALTSLGKELVDKYKKYRIKHLLEGMRATACYAGKPNPETGVGYGIRISKSDRDKFIERGSLKITIHLYDGPIVAASLSPSFWANCSEIRDKELGKWVVEKGGGTWEKGFPPTFNLYPLIEGESVSKTEFGLITWRAAAEIAGENNKRHKGKVLIAVTTIDGVSPSGRIYLMADCPFCRHRTVIWADKFFKYRNPINSCEHYKGTNEFGIKFWGRFKD